MMLLEVVAGEARLLEVVFGEGESGIGVTVAGAWTGVLEGGTAVFVGIAVGAGWPGVTDGEVRAGVPGLLLPVTVAASSPQAASIKFKSSKRRLKIFINFLELPILLTC
jgi:hypothetical protein